MQNSDGRLGAALAAGDIGVERAGPPMRQFFNTNAYQPATVLHGPDNG